MSEHMCREHFCGVDIFIVDNIMQIYWDKKDDGFIAIRIKFCPMCGMDLREVK